MTRPSRLVCPTSCGCRSNPVWAIDFEFDETADQRRLELANIVDEYTRQALAMRVGRTCAAEDLIVELEGPHGALGVSRHQESQAARAGTVDAHRTQRHSSTPPWPR